MYHEIAHQTALKSPWATLSLSCMKEKYTKWEKNEREKKKSTNEGEKDKIFN